jgi:hypothetical protein
MRNDTPTYGFGIGFVTCLVLLVVVAAGVQLTEWLATQPQPQALVQFLTAPMFSPLDVLTGLMLLATLWLIAVTLVRGPRL